MGDGFEFIVFSRFVGEMKSSRAGFAGTAAAPARLRVSAINPREGMEGILKAPIDWCEPC